MCCARGASVLQPVPLTGVFWQCLLSLGTHAAPAINKHGTLRVNFQQKRFSWTAKFVLNYKYMTGILRLLVYGNHVIREYKRAYKFSCSYVALNLHGLLL